MEQLPLTIYYIIKTKQKEEKYCLLPGPDSERVFGARHTPSSESGAKSYCSRLNRWDKFVQSTLYLFTQVYDWAHGYKHWWICAFKLQRSCTLLRKMILIFD